MKTEKRKHDFLASGRRRAKDEHVRRFDDNKERLFSFPEIRIDAAVRSPHFAKQKGEKSQDDTRKQGRKHVRTGKIQQYLFPGRKSRAYDRPDKPERDPDRFFHGRIYAIKNQKRSAYVFSYALPIIRSHSFPKNVVCLIVSRTV